MTAVARPVRSIYKEKAYGSNVKYLVEFDFDGQQAEVVPIHARDYEVKLFRKFQLTKELNRVKGHA